MNAKLRRFCLGIMIAALAVQGQRAAAALFAWDNVGGDGEWTNHLNWYVTNPGYPDDPADIASIQPVSPAGTINVSAPQSIDQISTATGGSYSETDYRFTGADLTLGHGTPIYNKSSNVVFTIDNRIILTAAGTATLTTHQGSSNIFNGGVVLNNANGLRLDRYLTSAGIGTYVFAASNTIDSGELVYVGNTGDGSIEVFFNASYPCGEADLALHADPPDSFVSLNTNVVILGELACGPDTNFTIRVGAGNIDRVLEFREMLRGGSVGGAIKLGTAADGGDGSVIFRHKPDTNINANALNFQVILDTVAGSIVELDSSLLIGTVLALQMNNNGMGQITGGGMLRKVGAGLSVIGNINQGYTGGTEIREGTIRIQKLGANPAGGLPDVGTVTIWSGATLHLRTAGDTIGALAGAGTVDLGGVYTLTVNEGITPGTNDVGTVSIDNNGGVTLANSSECVFELDALAAPYDQVYLDDQVTLTLDGALTIQNLGALELGDYVLFSHRLGTGSIVGGFNATNLPAGITAEVDTTTKDVILRVTSLPPTGTAVLIR